jgi:hypothetical protein
MTPPQRERKRRQGRPAGSSRIQTGQRQERVGSLETVVAESGVVALRADVRIAALMSQPPVVSFDECGVVGATWTAVEQGLRAEQRP